MSRKVHAVLDYPVGILLILSPWLFNFSDVRPATAVAIVMGVVIVVMSIFTNYEGGIRKVVPMKMHLYTDIIGGAFLALSPSLFRFSNEVYLPHVIIGLLAFVSGCITENRSFMPRENEQI